MIILYNPRSCDAKYRLPNTLLSLGSVIEGVYDYCIIDGNLLDDPYVTLESTIEHERATILGMTVMPGPQLMQAIDLSKRLKQRFPELIIIWGGYFPSNHTDVTTRAEYIDYVVRGPAEIAFPILLDAITGKASIEEVPSLSFMRDGELVNHASAPMLHPDEMPSLPYNRIDVRNYYARTYLGERTLSYHSSYGCPYECSFCAIVPIYKARWLGRSANRIVDDLEQLIHTYGGDSIEFHDNNFFTSEARVAEFSRELLRRGLTIAWWGEGRPDQLLKYSDETFDLMSRAGLKMIFMGAESGDDETLKAMNKGGTQTGETIIDVVRRMRRYGIVPECSFVLGTPSDNVDRAIDRDIAFIRRLKALNPETEIILYVYSPIPLDGADLFEAVAATGFEYPQSLDDWTKPEWRSFDLRRNPLTPWLKPEHIRRIHSFEAVLNARYPTNSDIKLKPYQVAMMKLAGGWRYATKFYSRPYEIKLLQRMIRYCQPEIQGF